MLDIKFIRENREDIKKAAKLKNKDINIEELLETDDRRKHLIQEFESRKAKQNAANKDISTAKGDEKKKAIEYMKKIADEIKDIEEQLKKVEEQYMQLMLRVPNIIHPGVPKGKDAMENVVVETIGKVPQFDFTPKDHIELMKMHDMIDIERGVKLSGARSYILKNEGALLQQAVLQYAFKKMVDKGFTPMDIPYMVDSHVLLGTGYFPGGEEDAYWLERDNKWLIGTSEQSVTAYYADEILEEKDLPKTFVALSPCFRREAGSYGKDTSGLYRVHQFNKVEQVILLPADVEASNNWLTKIILYAREILDDLKIPYRVLQLCTGDLALGKYNSLDIECYMPSRKGYGETHSATAFLDFQARRLKMRYKTKDGDTKYCYTLNNTVIALPRFLIPLLECNQQKDGSILIPKVLQPYMGKEKIELQ